MLLVTLAFVLAMPLAWLAGKHWLENYPYHIEIKIWVFALTALVSTAIALLTVGYQQHKVILLTRCGQNK
jgi:putative ABC transport system permease protein